MTAYALLCSFCVLLTACGKKEEERDSYIAVYEEFTEPTETVTEAETTAPVTYAPLTEDNGYLSDVLIIGDGECGKAVSCGLLTDDSVVSVQGAKPEDILSAEIDGKTVRDIIKASDKHYVYLMFTESQLLDSISSDIYGYDVFTLGEEIRELLPESMVIPLSVLPINENIDIAEYNDSLHMWVRSSPDEYLIYKVVSFVCGY